MYNFSPIFKNKKLNSIVDRRISDIKDNIQTFYLDTRESIQNILKRDSRLEPFLRFKRLQDLKTHLTKTNAYNGGSEIRYYELFKNNILFIGDGGLGKTHQLYIYHNQCAKSLLINSSDIPKLRAYKEFNDFIKNPKNTLLVDALNEGRSISYLSLFNKCKCKVVATTRPLDDNKHSKLKNYFYDHTLNLSIDGIDIAHQLNILNKLPLPFISSLNNLAPRMSLKLLTWINKNSKLFSKWVKDKKISPLSFLRDMIEQYLCSELANAKLFSEKNKDFWNFFKKTDNLLNELIQPISKKKIISILNKRFKNSLGIVDFMIRENIIQQKENGFILSDMNFYTILRTQELLSKGIALSDINTKYIEQLFNGIQCYQDDGLSSTIFSEIYFRLLKNKKCSINKLIKQILNISSIITLKSKDDTWNWNRKTHEDWEKFRKLKIQKKEALKQQTINEYSKYSWFSYCENPNVSSHYIQKTIISSLPVALKLCGFKYKIPKLILDSFDYMMSSENIILLNDYMPTDYINEYYAEDRVFFSDAQMLSMIDVNKIMRYRNWFWNWVWNNPFFIYNSIVLSKNSIKRNMLIKMILSAPNQLHREWFQIASLYWHHDLKFNLSSYADKWKVSPKLSSYNGFKHRVMRKEREDFKKYINNLFQRLKDKPDSHSGYSRNAYEFTRYAALYMSDGGHEKYKWESKLTVIIKKLSYEQFCKMVDKYYWNFDIEPTTIFGSLDRKKRVFDANIKNIDTTLNILDQNKLNLQILQYDYGKFSIGGETVVITSIKSPEHHVIFEKDWDNSHDPGVPKKSWYRNGYMINFSPTNYLGISYRGRYYLVDKLNKKIYDKDENFRHYSEDYWICERGFNDDLQLNEIINFTPPEK